MRSFVFEPMQYGNLFLAGDAAHVVPPTGAKGLNLAVGDVKVLSRGLTEFYRSGGRALLNDYSRDRAQAGVASGTFLMVDDFHAPPLPRSGCVSGENQLAELNNIVNSRAAATMLAENYVGMPIG